MSTEIFARERPRLLRLAYRMLGSVADSEDAVQDAWLRWQRSEVAIDDPTAWLVRVTTRLCLDRLRASRAERDRYVGAWLPDPIVERAPDALERAEEISFAFLLALERLSPLERAVFLLHDIFERDYAEIAATLERSEAACRQLATRAREHVRAAEPHAAIPEDEAARIMAAFFTAAASGDVGGLTALLTPDAMLTTDGGGKRRAALRPIAGADRVARFFVGVVRKGAAIVHARHELVRVNGLPGVLFHADGDTTVMAFDLRDGLINAIYYVSNPEKVAHLAE